MAQSAVLSTIGAHIDLQVFAATQSASIRLYGYIGGVDETGRGITESDFANKWNEAIGAGVKEVNILINSGGGQVWTGLPIYNLIKSSSVKVSCTVQGLAASMAAVIMLAADERNGYENCRIMLHQASGGRIGQANDLRKEADLLDGINADFARIIQEATGQSKEVVSGWMAEGKDSWFTAQEALAAGLLTEIIKPEGQKVKAFQGHDIEACVSHYAAAIDGCGCEKSKSKQSNNMNKIAKVLGLPAEATEEALVLAIEGMQQELLKERKAKVATALASAQASGVVTDQNAKAIEGLLEKDYDNAIALLSSLSQPIDKTPTPAPSIKEEARLSDLLAAVNRALSTTVVADDKSGWTLEEWRKKDPEGLAKLKAESPEKFQSLIKTI